MIPRDISQPHVPNAYNGFIGIHFINRTINDIIADLKYLKKNFGCNHCGIGSDFGGITEDHTTPKLETIFDYDNLYRALRKKGQLWSG